MPTQPCHPNKAPQVDEVLDTLSHHLRREILDYFENSLDSDTASVDEVVAHLNRRVPGETRQSLRLKLRHNHLPKLADRDWLTHDAYAGRIHYTGHDQAKQWLEEICGVLS